MVHGPMRTPPTGDNLGVHLHLFCLPIFIALPCLLSCFSKYLLRLHVSPLSEIIDPKCSQCVFMCVKKLFMTPNVQKAAHLGERMEMSWMPIATCSLPNTISKNDGVKGFVYVTYKIWYLLMVEQ